MSYFSQQMKMGLYNHMNRVDESLFKKGKREGYRERERKTKREQSDKYKEKLSIIYKICCRQKEWVRRATNKSVFKSKHTKKKDKELKSNLLLNLNR